MRLRQTTPKGYSCKANTKSKWTLEEDEKLSRVMNSLGNSNGPICWSHIKQRLPDLHRDPKQIRERWTQQLCPKIISPSILKEHEETIKEIYRRALIEKKTNRWEWISKQTSEVFNGYHYPANTIKNWANRHKDLKELEKTLQTPQLQRQESFDKIEVVLGPEFDPKKT